MIVRNEARIIDRCLAAAAPIIDAAVICDTGSTDDTPRLCREFLADRGVPALIASHVWTDFGRNRTAAVHAARDLVRDRGWPLDDTFWLLLDADQELVIDPDFSRDQLLGDAFLLRQDSPAHSFWNLRLCRAHLDWRAVGVTHEYFACPESPRVDRLETLWIRDHDDGGSKTDKLTRDIAWLTEALERQPGDPRTLFYLALSYAAAGDGAKALILFRRRVEAGGSEEERWYATFAMGKILANGGDVAVAERALLDAIEADPARAEPLCELARLFRAHGRREAAAAAAARAVALVYPGTRTLFVDRAVYEYGADVELALAAAGTPHHAEGFAAAERVVLSRRPPAAIIETVRAAELAYVAPLDGCAFLALRPDLAPPFRPCNPSVIRTPAGFLVNCRGVNYEQRRLRYRPLDEDQVFRTANVLMRLDPDGRVLDERPLPFDEPPPRRHPVQGLEDIRLVDTPAGLLALCTTTDRHPSGRMHQSLIGIDPGGRVTFHRPLVGPCDDRTQKNWLPFAGADGELYAIYGYDPLTILRLVVATGRYEVAVEMSHPIQAAGWRGSAGPLTLAGGRRLMLVHEAVRRQGPDDEWERVYTHRFVASDGEFRLRQVSRPFVFAHKGVEFCCGMAFGHQGDEIVCGLGIEDREAYLCRLTLARVQALLDAGESW